jgi:GT2 family glycosyltransferase
VSVVVPFRDGADLLQRCLDSVVADPGHDRIELLLVDNGSTEPETAALLDRLAGDDRVRVLSDPRPFNWAALNNAAISVARGDMVLTLNNDVTAASSGWLREMVVHAERPEIGCVGARLLYPDGRVQHVGTVVGLGGIVAHPMRGLPGDQPGYMGFATVARSWSAVTGACMLARAAVVDEVGGFDETLAVAFNDVDFCLRVGARGYRVVSTPLAELVHAESSTRGFTGYARDIVPFVTRWREILLGEDPMFSPNLSRFDARCVVRLADEDAQWIRHLHELGLS